jgi:hypothetical protein
MAEPILVEAECRTSTACDYDYFAAGHKYTIDWEWAKRRGIAKYFNPLQEVPASQVEEKVLDEIPEPKTRDEVYNKRVRAARKVVTVPGRKRVAAK